MADETIIIKYVLEADDAIKNAERIREVINKSKEDIKKMAAESGASFKDLGKSLIESFKKLSTADIEKLGSFLKIDPETLKQQSEFVRARQEAINVIRTGVQELGQEERSQASQTTQAIKAAKSQEIAAAREYERVTSQGYGVMSAAAMTYGQQVQSVKQQIVTQAQASGQTYSQVAQQMLQAGVSARVLNSALKELQQGATQTKSAFADMGSMIKQALIIGIGLNVYNMIQRVITYLREAAQSGYELAKALFQLDIGIRAVRRAGVDITTPEMFANLDKLSEKFGVFSKKSLVQGSAALINLIRDMGMTKDQIFELQDAIATLAIVNGRSMDEVQRTVALALSSGYTEGLQRLGVSINRVNIAARANAMGWEGGYIALTEHERAMATLSLIMEKTGKYSDDLTKYLDTEAGQLDVTTAALEDQKAALGEGLVPALTAFNRELYNLATLLGLVIKVASPFLDIVNILTAAVTELLNGMSKLMNPPQEGEGNFLERYVKSWEDGLAKIDRMIMKAAYENPWMVSKVNRESFKKMMEEKYGFGKMQPTEVPVGELDLTGDETGAEGKDLLEYVDELYNDIEEEKRRFNNRMAELERDLARDLEKIDRDMVRDLLEISRDFRRDQVKIREEGNRDLADAQADYERKLIEEARSYDQKVADAERKYRENEIQAEIEYQERLRKLREGFLYDLEDALRERDARQVLNLIRRFNLEKEQSAREYGIEADERRRRHQAEMEELAREREERLRVMAEELAIRLAQIKEETRLELEERRIKFEQEKADRMQRATDEKAERQIRYKEQQEELKIQFEERLKEIIAQLSTEKDMTAELLKQIGDEYRKTYGPNGVIEQQIMYYIGLLNSLSTAIGNATAGWSDVGTGGTQNIPGWNDVGTGKGKVKGFAEGGIMYADRPTTVMFGEKGLERAEFTPVNRTGRDQSEISYNVGDISERGGTIALRVLLSPELIAEIEENTLNQAANVLFEVQRGSV